MLQLDTTSWAHSLVAVERPAGEQRVSVVTLEEALAELPADASRTIVKIDAEGSEIEILRSAGSLDGVDVLTIEWHATIARCTEEELVEAVESRGLRMGDQIGGLFRFVR
jgi:hypothetical protein